MKKTKKSRAVKDKRPAYNRHLGTPVRLDPRLKLFVDEEAAKKGMGRAEFVNKMLWQYLRYLRKDSD